MARCSNCRASVPDGQLTRQKVFKGHNGRRKNGYLLMCGSCATTTQDSNQVLAVIVLVGMAIITVAVIAVRGS
ncbi:hypothetical protein BKE38_06340 [Pseudoroseomonas deserti]|uniref:Uncharacterized protein n=2 Tax=Teichococcus deserti TaxID=1817963 RepID=A0A1V2H646_9PROT|nr:hypothetical protein BKE38_06340 [Pseudoroseomonas deserti]